MSALEARVAGLETSVQDIRTEIRELRREMREEFLAQGRRIDDLGHRMTQLAIAVIVAGATVCAGLLGVIALLVVVILRGG